MTRRLPFERQGRLQVCTQPSGARWILFTLLELLQHEGQGSGYKIPQELKYPSPLASNVLSIVGEFFLTLQTGTMT